jgi:hypothetical protein
MNLGCGRTNVSEATSFVAPCDSRGHDDNSGRDIRTTIQPIELGLVYHQLFVTLRHLPRHSLPFSLSHRTQTALTSWYNNASCRRRTR